MAKHSNRAWNLTRKCSIGLSQAFARVEAKTAVWVDARTIRELSLAEVLETRRGRSPLTSYPFYRNIDGRLGTEWEPPESDKYAIRTRYPLMRQAIELLDAH